MTTIRNRKKIANIATQYYFSAVLERMGGITPAKLHRHFYEPSYESNSEYHEKNSRIIYKYIKGQVAVKNTDILNKIERELPGTKQILEHPLWLILDNPSADLNQIRQYMRLLDWDTQAKLFKQEKETNSYSRKIWNRTAPFSHISFKNDIDALACFLMLIKEQEILANWHCFVIAKWYAYELFLRLSFFEPMQIIRDELYHRIFFNFFESNNPITSNHIGCELTYTSCRDFLTSPAPIANFDWNSFFEIIINTANSYDVNANIKKEKLELLFWVFEIGIDQAMLLLSDSYRKSTPGNAYLNKLISAFYSTNHQRHMRNDLIFNFQYKSSQTP